jgi:hypothetical protein
MPWQWASNSMAASQAKMMSSSGSEVFLLKMASHRNGAMIKLNVTSVVWLVGATDWMIGAAYGDGVGIVAVVVGAFLWLPAVVVVPPLDPVPQRPPPLGVVAVAAGAVAVAALVGVAAWFAIPAHVTAPVLLLVILRPVVAIAGTTVESAVIVVVLVLLAVGGVDMIAAAAIVDAVAVVLMLRLTKSSTVLQLVISIAEGMKVAVDATACLWLTMTACALGSVPIKQTIEMSGHDCIPPNLAQL